MCLWVSHWIFHSTDSFCNTYLASELGYSLCLWVSHWTFHSAYSFSNTYSFRSATHCLKSQQLILLWIGDGFIGGAKTKQLETLIVPAYGLEITMAVTVGAIHTECVFAFHCQFSVVFLCKHMLGQQGSLLRLCHLQYSKNGPLKFFFFKCILC